MTWSELLRAALALVHVGVGAVWLGAMAYSLLVVQPRAERLLGDPLRYEEFAATVAAGARWPVLGMAATLAASGAGLVAVSLATRPSPGQLWVTLVLAKGVLLLVVVAVFWHVSWRLWPRRLFAVESELPGLKRQFRLVALVMLALVAADLTLGVLADSIG
jgi:hypothetical protein